MKRLIPLILMLCTILTACTGQSVSIRDALQIRAYEYDKAANTYTLTPLC